MSLSQRVYALALVAIAVMTCSCDRESSGDGVPASGAASAPPVTQVNETAWTKGLRGLSREERLREAIAVAKTLPARAFAHGVRDFAAASEELVEAGLWDVIDGLNAEFHAGRLDPAKEVALEWAVAGSAGTTKGEEFRKRMASRNPTSIALAPFREGGLLYLLQILEDESANIVERVQCARLLSGEGDRAMLPRLRKLAGDRTRVPSDNPLPTLEGEPSETLGTHVRICIAAILARSPE